MPNSLTIKVFVELYIAFILHTLHNLQQAYFRSLAWHPQYRLQPQFSFLAQFAYFRSKRRESRQDLSDHLNAALWEKGF